MDGGKHVGCEGYSIPEGVRGEIDIITPTVHFARMSASNRHSQKRPLMPEHTEALQRITQRATEPTIQSPEILGQERKRSAEEPALSKRKETSRIKTTSMKGKIGSPLDGSNPKQGSTVNNALADLSTCNIMITPDCLRALYKIPQPSTKTPQKNNTLGIVEYTPQAFLQSDLTLFQESFSPNAAGKAIGAPRVYVRAIFWGAIFPTSAVS